MMGKEAVCMGSKACPEFISGWWKKALGGFVGTAVLALGVSAPVFASPAEDEFVTQEDLKALKEEVKTLRDELKSIKAVKPEMAPAITGNVYSELSRKIKLGGEVRARFESFYNFDFDGSPNDSDGEGGHNEITLLRTRLNLDADVNDYLRAYLELQDNRAFGDEDEFDAAQGRKTGTDLALNPRGTMGNLGRVDLLQGFLELRSLAPVSSALSDVSVKIGRFQMSYGGERLISEYDWSNQGRAFDGARVRYSKNDAGWIDGFVTQIDEDFSDSVGSDRDEIFWGVYGHCTALKGIIDEIEPYFLGRNMSRSMGDPFGVEIGSFGIPMSFIDKEDRYTTGVRIAGEPTVLPGLDYELEGAYQFGHVELIGDDFDIKDAYAFFASAGYTLKDMPWTPRFGGGFSYATGTSGSEGGKGDLNTFDQLYPSGYELGLGHMELVGWQNIIDYRVNVSAKPTKKWLLKGDFHFLYLEEAADAWFNANGNAIAAWDPSLGSKPNDQLGKEFDLTAKYELFKNFHVALGYSHFFAGNFIESDSVAAIESDGSFGSSFGDSDADWFYVMTTLKF